MSTIKNIKIRKNIGKIYSLFNKFAERAKNNSLDFSEVS